MEPVSIVKHLRQFATIHITLLRFALVCTVIVISRVGVQFAPTHPIRDLPRTMAANCECVYTSH